MCLWDSRAYLRRSSARPSRLGARAALTSLGGAAGGARSTLARLPGTVLALAFMIPPPALSPSPYQRSPVLQRRLRFLDPCDPRIRGSALRERAMASERSGEMITDPRLVSSSKSGIATAASQALGPSLCPYDRSLPRDPAFLPSRFPTRHRSVDGPPHC